MASTKPTHVISFASPNSLQASGKIAKFAASCLGLPLVQGKDRIRELAASVDRRKLRLLIANAPFAFVEDREGVAELFTKTQSIIWLQNDYSVDIPTNMNHSKPSQAESPLRVALYYVPEFSIWSTCKDRLKLRANLGHPDQYVNWNALTYSPFESTLSTRSMAAFYYGSLRKSRTVALSNYLNTKFCTVSPMNKHHVQKWQDLCPRLKVHKEPPPEWTHREISFTTKVGARYVNENLLKSIDFFQHSLLLSDKNSQDGRHSPPNRWYEVLSTPSTILWLEQESRGIYDKLPNCKEFKVKDADHLRRRIKSLSTRNCQELASMQRELWVPDNPYVRLRKRVRTLYDSL